MIETAAAAPAAGAGFGYADSVESSPRSRGGDSWDEPSFPSSGAAGRLRLMCSYGGRIFPRPTDKSLCYLGGETRMVVVDRHSSLADISARLSRTLLGGRPFTIKYQLPNEDLDSLISVATDEDLENMVEEYDRILSAASGGSARSSRLRLFLFPSKPEVSPTSSIGSLLDDSKSETWFVDALNSAMGGMGIDGLPRGLSSDSTSVNCLLGLDDDSSVHSRGGGGGIIASGGGGGAPHSERAEQHVLPSTDSSGKHARQGQDFHSVPDSPMLDTTSSFGSGSSVPSLSNLPPIRVRSDDRQSDSRTGGLDDQFTRVNLSSGAATAGAGGGQRVDDDSKETSQASQRQPPQPISLSASSASALTVSPNENPNRPFSPDDEKSDHGGIWKPLLQQPPKPTLIEAPIHDSASRTMYLNANTDPKREFPVSSDAGYRFQIPASETAGYQLPPMQPEQFQEQQFHPQLHHHQQQQHQQQQQQQQQQHQQQQHQQQQQFIPANPHYIHHPATGGVMQVPSYFPVPSHTIQQSPQTHPYDHQIPVYYYPVQPNPSYNLAAMQPGLADPNSMPSATKPAMPAPRVPVNSELPANLYRTAAAAAPTPAPTLPPQLIHVAADQAHTYAAGMGYHVVSQQQHHHLSQSPAAMANYGYEFAATLGHHPQAYYSQGAPPPAVAPQCQPMSSAAAADAKSARAS